MKMVGIILAGGAAKTNLERAIAAAALPVAGRYRAVDFPLSNMSNSGINKVAVVTQFSSRKLSEHLRSSSWWGFGRKHGGISMISPMVTEEKQQWYQGTVDAMADTLEFLRDSHEPYVAIASGDGVYKIDFDSVLKEHINCGADLTLVCTALPSSRHPERYGNVKISEDGRVTSFIEKPGEKVLRIGSHGKQSWDDGPASQSLVSCGIYIIRRRAFISLISDAAESGKKDFVREVLIPMIETSHVHAYVHNGYWNNISTEKGFYEGNMDFLKAEVRSEFFDSDPQIYSRIKDDPPAKYLAGAQVSGSIIAGGAVIDGKVENSVIFPGVVISRGACVRNCVVLKDTIIEENEVIEGRVIEP